VMNVLRNAQDTPHLLSKQKVVSELQSVGYWRWKWQFARFYMFIF
jgi:hypothetical protein